MLGSLNMDLVVRVHALPKPGNTVLGDRLLRVQGGKGANQAAAAARLGAQVRMVGRVGADAFGDDLLSGLAADGVDVSGITRDTGEPSGTALIVVEASGQNLIAVAPGANGRVGDAEVERLRDGLRPGDIVVLQLEVPLTAVIEAAAAARHVGAGVVLNAAPSTPLAGGPVPEVDLLVVNEGEAGELAGLPVSGWAAAERAAARIGGWADAVAVTLGAAGALLWNEGVASRIDPRHVEAVDATAAGDAFVGATAVGLAAGWSLRHAVELGGAAGAAAVTRPGARSSLPRPADLHRLFGVEVLGSASAR